MGAFTTAPMLPAVQARSVETGDLDRDGDIDLLLGGRILFNNGAGVFTLGPVLASVTSGQSEGWAIFDVDADQDLDIVHPGGDIFLANGTGGFSPAIPGWPSTTILVGNTPLEARGDFDGDADVDFVSPTGHRLINTTLHLEATSLAHTGRIARFGLAGAASASWFLALAAQPASILASPYGTLRLDPATLTFVGSGSLGTAGEATVQLAVPNVATLAGTTVHLQAVVGTAFGPRLTRRIAPIIVD